MYVEHPCKRQLEAAIPAKFFPCVDSWDPFVMNEGWCSEMSHENVWKATFSRDVWEIKTCGHSGMLVTYSEFSVGHKCVIQSRTYPSDCELNPILWGSTAQQLENIIQLMKYNRGVDSETASYPKGQTVCDMSSRKTEILICFNVKHALIKAGKSTGQALSILLRI